MKGGTSYQPAGASTSGKAYQRVFVRRVHALLGLGHAKLTPSNFSCALEQDITGELVHAIDSVLEAPQAPTWAPWFSVHEEPPVYEQCRQGRDRRQLDIRIDSSQASPRPRFRFEAKRLGPRNGVSAYLGTEGIQRFLDGRYARCDRAAGMLGYVQAGRPDDWAVKIGKAITRNGKKLGLLSGSPWRRKEVAAELSHTYRSGHERPKVGVPVEIYHTMLLFN